MNKSLETALKETWSNKEKFYEDTKHMDIKEIIEKIEGKKFNYNIKETAKHQVPVHAVKK